MEAFWRIGMGAAGKNGSCRRRAEHKEGESRKGQVEGFEFARAGLDAEWGRSATIFKSARFRPTTLGPPATQFGWSSASFGKFSCRLS